MSLWKKTGIGLIVLVVGCNPTIDQRLTGGWTVDLDRTNVQIPSFIPRPKRFRDLILGTTLKLSSDHTFAMSGFMAVTGTWTYQTGKLTLVRDESSASLVPNRAPKSFDLSVDPAFQRMEVRFPFPGQDLTVWLIKTS